MTIETPVSASQEYTFTASEWSRITSVFKIMSGFVLVFIAIIGFALSVYSRSANMFSLQMATTIPMMAAIGLFATGIAGVMAPRRVVVATDGITVEYAGSLTHIAWERIGNAKLVQASILNPTRLAIIDVAGKSLVKIPATLTDFGKLTDIVQTQVTHNDAHTSELIAKKKTKRGGVFAVVFSVLMLALSGFLLYDTRQKQLQAARFITDALPGEARVVRRFVAPNQVTRRIEFVVKSSSGKTATHNVELEPRLWDAVKEGDAIPVMMVPDDPEIARLIVGEVRDPMLRQDPAMMYLLCAAVGICSLFLLVGGVLALRGIEITSFDGMDQFRSRK